jgi:sporulation protein YabP
MRAEEKHSFRGGQHRLVIENREHTEVTGVIHVDSFDDEEVIMETELGLLAVRGENLHIKHLNLEQGEVSIDGYILEIAYAEEKRSSGRGKNLLGRLFK